MTEFFRNFEEKEYGPKLAMAATIAMIIYLVIAK